MTQIMSNDKQGLSFEIISTKVAEQEERKYVIYTLQVRFISNNDDANPSVIERRYTNFLELYTKLKKEYPNLMNGIVFPKKALTGNFTSELIFARSTGFESLLKHISNNSQLRNSFAFIAFLQDVELREVKALLSDMKYLLAYPIVENSLKLLNKVYTDRSPVVLLALVRLIACGSSLKDYPDVLKWADLALHRFEGVSDSDLLKLYVPLFQTCVKLWCQNDRNPKELEKTLLSLQKQGVNMEETSLMEAVDVVERKIFCNEYSK